MVKHSERASRVSTDDVFGNFLKSVLKTFRCGIYVQWNLSIADMLYSGQLSIADTFPKNGLNHGQSLIENLFVADRNSGHLSIADTFLGNQ